VDAVKEELRDLPLDLLHLLQVLGVHPDFQGRAVGRQLAGAMLDHFRARGAHKVRTLVDDSMPDIGKFFRSLGFAPAPVTALAMPLTPEAT
jgi:ribosomal protein S18 acetylase RimI-like enzyme